MVRYYCPYCNPKYQFQKQSSKGNLICGLCGEDLVKKPFIRLNQIIALVAASSLLLPLIYTFIFLIKNQLNPPNKNYQANSRLMIVIKDKFFKLNWKINAYQLLSKWKWLSFLYQKSALSDENDNHFYN